MLPLCVGTEFFGVLCYKNSKQIEWLNTPRFVSHSKCLLFKAFSKHDFLLALTGFESDLNKALNEYSKSLKSIGYG